MTSIRQIYQLLKRDYTVSRPGRQDVPDAAIILDDEREQFDFRSNDAVVVKDGGSLDLTPQSFGWSEEKVDATVDIECHTSDRRVGGTKQDGRVNLLGVVGADGGLSAETYGGIAGEARKVITDVRKGFASWDRVEPSTIQDVSETVGQKRYKAVFTVNLVNEARVI